MGMLIGGVWYEGPSGASGPRGPAGLSGPSGNKGPDYYIIRNRDVIGISGPSGGIGSQGPQGYSNTLAPRGPSGPIGDRGPSGPSLTSISGPSGPRGSSGPRGLSGPRGPSGSRGATGPSGLSLRSTDLISLRDAPFRPSKWWDAERNTYFLGEIDINNTKFIRTHPSNSSFYSLNSKLRSNISVSGQGFLSGYCYASINERVFNSYSIDTNVWQNYYLPQSSSSNSIVYARIKNTANYPIKVFATQIIFYYGSPGPGQQIEIGTISAGETKYFSASKVGPYLSWNQLSSAPLNPWNLSFKDTVFVEDDLYIISNSGRYYGEAIEINNKSNKDIRFYFPAVGTDLNYSSGYSSGVVPSFGVKTFRFYPQGGMSSATPHPLLGPIGLYEEQLNSEGITHTSFNLIEWDYTNLSFSLPSGRFTGTFTERINPDFIGSITDHSGEFLSGISGAQQNFNLVAVKLKDEIRDFYVIGASGPMGVSGPMGSPISGPSGPKGFRGPSGPIGSIGFSGPIGLAGSTGPQGPRGPISLNPISGLSGPIGLQGPMGPSGPSGFPGNRGQDQAFSSEVFYENNISILVWPDANSSYSGNKLLEIYGKYKSTTIPVNITLLPGLYSFDRPLELTSNNIKIKGFTENPDDVTLAFNRTNSMHYPYAVVQNTEKIYLENLTIKNISRTTGDQENAYLKTVYFSGIPAASFSNEYTEISRNYFDDGLEEKLSYRKVIEPNGENAFISKYPISGLLHAFVRRDWTGEPLSIGSLSSSGDKKIWKHISLAANTTIWNSSNSSTLILGGKVLSWENPLPLTGVNLSYYSGFYHNKENCVLSSWPWEVNSWAGENLSIKLSPINSFLKNVKIEPTPYALSMAPNRVYAGNFIDVNTNNEFSFAAFGGRGGYLTGNFINCVGGDDSFASSRFLKDVVGRDVFIKNCIAGNYSFGTLGRISGQFIDLTIHKYSQILEYMGELMGESFVTGIFVKNINLNNNSGSNNNLQTLGLNNSSLSSSSSNQNYIYNSFPGVGGDLV